MAYIGKTPTPAPLTSSDITNGIVTGEKLNADVISSQTELATAPADTDEFLISDAGVLKRLDASLIGGGGKLLQIVQAQFSSAMSTSAGNSTQVDTGLTANITPSATSSKVLVFVTHPHVRKSGDTQLDFQLVRDSTVVYDNIGNHDTGDTQQIHVVVAFQYLDSPNTTSQVTYKTRMAAGNGYLYAQSGSSNIILCEIGA